MPSTATRSSRTTAKEMPTRAWTGACTSWSGRSPSTRTSSATASTPTRPSRASAGPDADRFPTTTQRQRVMKLRDFIVTQAIVPELTATDRDGAIRELVGSLAAAGAVPQSSVDDVVAALVKREQNGSTGFGKGVAVPHVKHPKVKAMAGTIGRSVNGIDFAALDHQPVYTIVLLLSPENQPQQHLQAMNIVFSNLQKDMFRRWLRGAETREAIIELLDDADQGK